MFYDSDEFEWPVGITAIPVPEEDYSNTEGVMVRTDITPGVNTSVQRLTSADSSRPPTKSYTATASSDANKNISATNFEGRSSEWGRAGEGFLGAVNSHYISSGPPVERRASDGSQQAKKSYLEAALTSGNQSSATGDQRRSSEGGRGRGRGLHAAVNRMYPKASVERMTSDSSKKVTKSYMEAALSYANRLGSTCDEGGYSEGGRAGQGLLATVNQIYPSSRASVEKVISDSLKKVTKSYVETALSYANQIGSTSNEGGKSEQGPGQGLFAAVNQNYSSAKSTVKGTTSESSKKATKSYMQAVLSNANQKSSTGDEGESREEGRAGQGLLAVVNPMYPSPNASAERMTSESLQQTTKSYMEASFPYANQRNSTGYEGGNNKWGHVGQGLFDQKYSSPRPYVERMSFDSSKNMETTLPHANQIGYIGNEGGNSDWGRDQGLLAMVTPMYPSPNPSVEGVTTDSSKQATKSYIEAALPHENQIGSTCHGGGNSVGGRVGQGSLPLINPLSFSSRTSLGEYMARSSVQPSNMSDLTATTSTKNEPFADPDYNERKGLWQEPGRNLMLDVGVSGGFPPPPTFQPRELYQPVLGSTGVEYGLNAGPSMAVSPNNHYDYLRDAFEYLNAQKDFPGNIDTTANEKVTGTTELGIKHSPNHNLPDATNTGSIGIDGAMGSPYSCGDFGQKFSRKVFAGGLPPDMNEAEIIASFSVFGSLTLDFPEKALTRALIPTKRFVFLQFDETSSVQHLVKSCSQHKGRLYCNISSTTATDKAVQIRPWRLSDSDFIMDDSVTVDPRKTVFIGSLPRPLKAVDLAAVMNSVFNGVSYASVLTDPIYQYPKAAGLVTFSSQQSFICAIRSKFVEIPISDDPKKCVSYKLASIKPYVLNDQMCDECGGELSAGQYAPYFCGSETCLKYYCEHCWYVAHCPADRQSHKPLIKGGKTLYQLGTHYCSPACTVGKVVYYC